MAEPAIKRRRLHDDDIWNQRVQTAFENLNDCMKNVQEVADNPMQSEACVRHAMQSVLRYAKQFVDTMVGANEVDEEAGEAAATEAVRQGREWLNQHPGESPWAGIT